MLTDDEIVAAYSAGEFTLPHREFVIDAGRKIIAAYRAKLRQGVELPEANAHIRKNGFRFCDFVEPQGDTEEPLFTKDQLQQYAAAAAVKARMEALSEAKGVCESFKQGVTMYIDDDWADMCAAAIESLKGKQA